ncbi:glucosamine inositolphosphorylceramide transferase family protein [Asticcacaulis solisilvae]|uniref:glucosamine inositolphosphorylceramide transferase family protein n=1 Tax=Asticcacaulis solisilvae TaxID=1217274 RepID=UPI003FD8033E
MARKTTELWHTGIVAAPIAGLMTSDALHSAEIHWLPDPGAFRFIADPFGIWRQGRLTILAEALDYRVKRGEIHYFILDETGGVAAQGLALREPFHLSYPVLLTEGDDVFMLPEGHRSGKLTLYRAEHFPDRWLPAQTLLDLPAIDASPVRYGGRWWMFFALPGDDNRAMRELHVAFADSLHGPWHLHPANPVRNGLDSARPGGTPFEHDGTLHLPTQDCVGGYGRGISLLRFDMLSETRVETSVVSSLKPQGLRGGWDDGLHTLSAAGNVTLIDVKRLDPSPGRVWIDLQRRLRRLLP